MKKSDKACAIAVIVTTCVSVVGVITTAVLASKAAPKAQKRLDNLKKETPEPTKLEVVKAVAPAYAAAAVSGAVTIACIVGTSLLNKKQQTSISSAYALLNHNYQRYRQTVKKIFGEDADQKVVDEIVKSERTSAIIYDPAGLGRDLSELDFDEELLLFYDSYSERYYNASLRAVLLAEYHLNRNFTRRGSASVNEYYEFLGLDGVEMGEDLQWTVESGLEWVDFDHRRVSLENDGNLKCIVVNFVFPPEDTFI